MMDCKTENNWLIGLHLIQLLNVVVPLGGLLGAVAIWHLKQEESEKIHVQGKEILNFQFSMAGILFLVFFIEILGLFGLRVTAYEPANTMGLYLASILACSFVLILHGVLIGFPLLSARRIREGKGPYYPGLYRFFR